MKVIITTKNLEKTPDLNDLVTKKFESLKKYINILKREDEIGKTLAEVFVDIEKENRHHKKGKIYSIKTKILLPGRLLVARARENNLFKAITGAKKELKSEIKKYKFKIIDKNIRKNQKIKNKTKI